MSEVKTSECAVYKGFAELCRDTLVQHALVN